RFHHWPTNRVWTRDSGCAFVAPTSTTKSQILPEDQITTPEALRYAKADSQSPRPVAKSTTRMGQRSSDGGVGALARMNELKAIKWKFNAWAKYANWRRDNKIGTLMAESAGAEQIEPMLKGKQVV